MKRINNLGKIGLWMWQAILLLQKTFTYVKSTASKFMPDNRERGLRQKPSRYSKSSKKNLFFPEFRKKIDPADAEIFSDAMARKVSAHFSAISVKQTIFKRNFYDLCTKYHYSGRRRMMWYVLKPNVNEECASRIMSYLSDYLLIQFNPQIC